MAIPKFEETKLLKDIRVEQAYRLLTESTDIPEEGVLHCLQVAETLSAYCRKPNVPNIITAVLIMPFVAETAFDSADTTFEKVMEHLQSVHGAAALEYAMTFLTLTSPIDISETFPHMGLDRQNAAIQIAVATRLYQLQDIEKNLGEMNREELRAALVEEPSLPLTVEFLDWGTWSDTEPLLAEAFTTLNTKLVKAAAEPAPQSPAPAPKPSP